MKTETLQWLTFKVHLLDAKKLGWPKDRILGRVSENNPLCPFLCLDCPKARKRSLWSTFKHRWKYGVWPLKTYRPVGDIPGWSQKQGKKMCVCPFVKSSKCWINQARWWQKLTQGTTMAKSRPKLEAYIEEVWNGLL